MYWAGSPIWKQETLKESRWGSSVESGKL